MQAARGASLTGDDNGTNRSPGRPEGSRARFLLLFAAVALSAYAVDVISKVVAVEKLTDRPDFELVGELFVLHLARNPGAAFSTGTEYTEVLSVLAIIAVGVVLWLARKVGSVGWAVALGFLLAGVAGNLTDRLLREPGPLRGHVVDMFMLPNWPVFNVADVCIIVAAVLILVQVYRGIRIDGTRVEQETTDEDEPSPEPGK